MKIAGLKTFIVGNPPPTTGGRYFIFLKLITDEGIEIFLARKLEKRERKLDQGEFLELLIVDFEEAVGMIRDGRITDAKTVSALLWVATFARNGQGAAPAASR